MSEDFPQDEQLAAEAASQAQLAQAAAGESQDASQIPGAEVSVTPSPTELDVLTPETTETPADLQPQTDENGYLSDGTKPSYVQSVDLAHEAANASNEDRSVSALHREQGETYQVVRGNNVNRDRHYDVAQAIDALADLKENAVLNPEGEIVNLDNSETIDDQERERINRLVEIRAGAAKLRTAFSGSAEDITQSLRKIGPPNAYADQLRYRHHSVYKLKDQSEYDKAFFEKAKDLAYAQKFGVVSDRQDAEKEGVELTLGWPDKYSRWRNTLGNTVELDARSLLSRSSDEEGKVTYSVKESGVSDWTVNEFSDLAKVLSYHANTYYARIETSPSIVIGQGKDGHVVAKAYFIVQVGDRTSKNLEVVELHDVDNILKLASDRLRPFTDEADEGQRLANLIEPEAVKEDAYEQAEARNEQFIEEFKVSTPEYDDVPDTELRELLRMAATGEAGAELTKKQELLLKAMGSGGKLQIVTSSDGTIVDHESIRKLPNEEYWNGTFEVWNISGVDKVLKTTYEGSPWHIAGRKVRDATDANMPPDEIVSLRKRVLDIQLNQSAA